MIGLKENRVSIHNLPLTIEAYDELGKLIDHFSVPRFGPAYLIVDADALMRPKIQLDRAIFVAALEAQRDKLEQYLAKLGIDVHG